MSVSSSPGAAGTTMRAADRLPGWVRPKVVFLGLVLIALVGYTEMAFALEWRTNAGRIGPGFFPRILGVTALLMTAWALVAAVRAPGSEDEVVPLEDEMGEADLGKHPRLLTIMVLTAAVFAATLVALGAVVSSAVFLGLMLWLLNRSHPALNAAVAIGTPLAMYLLFQTLLNAGLPAGVLPFL